MQLPIKWQRHSSTVKTVAFENPYTLSNDPDKPRYKKTRATDRAIEIHKNYGLC